MVASFQSYPQDNRRFPKARNDGAQNLEPEPPNNFDLECEVLGSFFLDKSVLLKVVNILKADYFFDPRCKYIYEGILELYKTDSEISITNMVDVLKGMKVNPKWENSASYYEAIGEKSLLSLLPGCACSVNNIELKVKSLEEKWGKRCLLALTKEITRVATDDSFSFQEAFEKSIRAFQTVSITQDEGLTPMDEIVTAQLNQIESIRKGEFVPAWPTGIHALDRMWGGLRCKELYGIGGRTSMGKTLFALWMAKNMANVIEEFDLHKNGKKFHVHYFSPEVNSLMCAARLQASESGVSYADIDGAQWKPEKEDTVMATIGMSAMLPILFSKKQDVTVEDIINEASQKAQLYPPAAIFIDHLGYLPKDKTNLRIEYGFITKRLRALAAKLDCPVIYLHQLNRGATQSQNGEVRLPDLVDFSESDDIVRDSTGLLAVHRPEYYAPSPENEGRFIVRTLKCNHGSKDDNFELYSDLATNSLVNPESHIRPKPLYENLARYQERQNQLAESQPEEKIDF